MAGSFIEVAARDGGRFNAYMARPAQGSGPGLVLLQEIFGINDYLKQTADRYAEEGYVVLVPDLFWRMQPNVVLGYDGDDMKRALDFHAKFDVDLAVQDIAATLDSLRALPEQQGKIGTIGYCLGGKLALLAAARTDVDCAVSYYGVGLEAYLDEVKNIRCPMVFHFPENDAYCPPPVREQIMAALRAHPNIEQYVYPGCDRRARAPAIRQARRDDGVLANAGAAAQGARPDLRSEHAVGAALLFRVRDAGRRSRDADHDRATVCQSRADHDGRRRL